MKQIPKDDAPSEEWEAYWKYQFHLAEDKIQALEHDSDYLQKQLGHSERLIRALELALIMFSSKR